MITTINRNALILFPAKPLTDWVNIIFDDSPTEEIRVMGHDEGNIYLIPDSDSTEESLKWLKKNYKEIFEEELFGWCTDDSQWPEDLSWEVFCSWFHFSIQSMVFDASKGPIRREQL